MTLGDMGGKIINGKAESETKIGLVSGNTEDSPVIRATLDGENTTEIESELTSGDISRRLPSLGKDRSEVDELTAKSRAAQASALFDPEAMALLETLVKKPLFNFQELVEENLTPRMWVKLSVLVRAYLVEPLDNGVRVTTEGSEALNKMSKYLSKLDVKTHRADLEKGL